MKLLNILYMFSLVFYQTISTCQSQSNLDISYSGYNYFIGENNINVIEIVIENFSDFDYVIWLDSANIVEFNEMEKVHSYFHVNKGDFSLYNLMTEGLLVKDSPIIFGNLLKQIKQNEKFIIRVIGKVESKEKCIKFITEHFVAVKKDALLNKLQLGDDLFYWYDRQSIDLNEESLKF